jgi:hypothetical protein
MQLLRDLKGNIIPLGKVEISRSYAPTLDGTIPSWLEVDTGTGARVAPGTGTFGRFTLTSGNVSGNFAQIRTVEEFDAAQYEEILWTAQGLHLDSETSVDVWLAIDNASTTGVHAIQATANTTVLLGRSGDRDTTSYKWQGGGEGTKRRNLSLLWRPKLDRLWLLEDDQVVAHVEKAAIATGLVRARLVVITRSAAARVLGFSKVELKLRHN